MILTNDERSRLASWKEGELMIDNSRPITDQEDRVPVLIKVCMGILSKHWHKHKTARGRLAHLAKVIDEMQAVLKKARLRR